jgi:outer membrane factor, OMF family
MSIGVLSCSPTFAQDTNGTSTAPIPPPVQTQDAAETADIDELIMRGEPILRGPVAPEGSRPANVPGPSTTTPAGTTPGAAPNFLGPGTAGPTTDLRGPIQPGVVQPNLNPPVPSTYTSDSDSGLTPQEKLEAKTIELTRPDPKDFIPIAGGKLPPIRLEATFNQPITLREVLNVALENNLPIKISRQGYESQKYLFYAALGRFLPDLNMIYRTQYLMREGAGPVNTRTFATTVRYPVFQGGRVVFGSMVNYYRMKSGQYQYSATINDTLFSVYNLYNQLLLNEALLLIRLKSVEVSRAQLRLNEQLRNAGTGTNFAVMQSRTQLALDKQNLLLQQVQVRQSSLQLALALNSSVAINLMPEQRRITETRLVDLDLNAAQLTNLAMNNRPELKQFNYNRLAQARNVQLTAAPLMPTAQFFLTFNRAETSGGGSSGGGGTGNLGAQASTGAAGAGVGGSPVVGVGPQGIGGATIVNAGGGGGSFAVGGSANQSFTAGFDINWNLAGMGVPDTMNVLSARALSRQALLQYNQQVITVMQQVRSSYLNSLAAEEQVDVAGEAVVSSAEGLRLANLRLQNGVGTNLELIQAQRDYINSLITQAQAIINFNISQAQLLRDMGTISVPTLTAELNRPIAAKPIEKKLL